MSSKVTYWIDESLETIDTAKVLLDKSKYLEAAFFCHLACEKMLKAAVVKATNETPPKIHSLPRLSSLAEIDGNLTNEQNRFIFSLDAFQIDGRYPPERTLLYQTTSHEEFEQMLKDTEELILWIKSLLT